MLLFIYIISYVWYDKIKEVMRMNPVINHQERLTLKNRMLKGQPFNIYNVEKFTGPSKNMPDTIKIRIRADISGRIVYHHFRIEVETEAFYHKYTTQIISDVFAEFFFTLDEQILSSLYQKRLDKTRLKFLKDYLQDTTKERIDNIYDYFIQFRPFFIDKMERFNKIYQIQSIFYLGA